VKYVIDGLKVKVKAMISWLGCIHIAQSGLRTSCIPKNEEGCCIMRKGSLMYALL
jgi:hypothetical protein